MAVWFVLREKAHQAAVVARLARLNGNPAVICYGHGATEFTAGAAMSWLRDQNLGRC
jgi:hypothetical protein